MKKYINRTTIVTSNTAEKFEELLDIKISQLQDAGYTELEIQYSTSDIKYSALIISRTDNTRK